MIRRMEIAREFDALVKATGGKIIAEIVGKSPRFDNADYIFPEEKIVAELKCLREDKSGDASTRFGMWWFTNELVHLRLC